MKPAGGVATGAQRSWLSRPYDEHRAAHAERTLNVHGLVAPSACSPPARPPNTPPTPRPTADKLVHVLHELQPQLACGQRSTQSRRLGCHPGRNRPLCARAGRAGSRRRLRRRAGRWPRPAPPLLTRHHLVHQALHVLCKALDVAFHIWRQDAHAVTHVLADAVGHLRGGCGVSADAEPSSRRPGPSPLASRGGAAAARAP